MRDQCYDGCATMIGKKTGVTTQIKNYLQPLALSTHSYTHSLNLACGDWIRKAAIVLKSLDTSYKITKLTKFFPKRDSHLRKIYKEEYCENIVAANLQHKDFSVRLGRPQEQVC